MALTYAQYVTTIANLTAYDAANADFLQILPSAIAYAENRIYRDLDLMVENVTDGSGSCTPSSRNFNLPTSLGVYSGPLDRINVITPAATAPDSGTRWPLIPVSADFLNMAWPSSTGAARPQYFAYVSQSAASGQYNIILGPWPDAAYRIEVTGQIQPTALSSGNTTTYVSTYYEDLLVAASMVFMAGYQRDFGAATDDPKASLSWESQYSTLLKSAMDYEARKRFAGASWSPKPIEPIAQPQRG